MISTGISGPDEMLGGGIPRVRPETFARARDLIGLVAKKRVPVVIAANRHDLPGAAGEGAIRRTVGILDEVPVFTVSAFGWADMHRVLESMVDRVTQFSN